MTKKEWEALKKSKQAHFQKMLGLAVATELYGTKFSAPKVIVNMGTECYTDNRVIVIGLNSPAHEWCEDEIDLYESCDYIRGHETGHIKHTTDKAWNYALKRGCEVVIERLCKDNGIYLRFSNDRDYENALLKLSDKGVKLSMQRLKYIVYFITNSLEDGREEAIRASENTVFKNQMIHIRLLNWKLNGIDKATLVENMDSLEKLMTILNQVLSLSTESVYQKGFTKAYIGTELYDRVSDVIPNIAQAVMSKRCRGMAEQSIKICEKLSDLIGEASKCSDFEKAIEWIKMSIKDIEFAERNTKDDAEEEGNQECTPFNNSDLYVILPDDEYDELMEKLKEQEDNGEKPEGPQMHIKREHPKEEENKEENKEENNNSGDGNNKDVPNDESQGDNTSKESSTGSGVPSDEEIPDSSLGKDENKVAENDASESNSDSSPTSDSSSDNSNKNKSGDGEKQNAETQASNNNETQDSENAGGGPDSVPQGQKMQSGKSGENKGGEGCEGSGESADIDAIEEQMKQAAEMAAGMAKDESELLNRTIEGQEKSQSMKEDVSQPLEKTSESTVNSINAAVGGNYKLIELERKYSVDTLIEPAFMSEIEKFKKTVESLLRTIKKKYHKYLNQGKLDSSRCAMLAANEINVFKESKISKGTSACAELIVDNSGSMGYGAGSKREYACKALSKIEMAFASFFPIKIFAFDGNGSSVIHEIIKNWDEKFSRCASWNFLEKGRYGSSNNDAFSIRVATADLLKRSEKRKLLCVLSDGAPCYGGAEDVKAAVREARLKGITVVGIYFSEPGYPVDEREEEFFASMYEKDYIVCEPEEISENLTRILKKFFL